MWLLETEQLQLHYVNDSADEKYAILSHTWDHDHEVSFQDIQHLTFAKTRPGFEKIRKTCDIARSKKFQYVWIDTCCIDKTSSAELSEAINSMFRWYKDSTVCYVYLSDFEPLSSLMVEKDRLATIAARFGACRWFTRGWTLQELIASGTLEFFDRDWNFLGGKDDLESYLSSLTRIDRTILRNCSGLHTIPTGRKMSWAAGRQTTRIEDRAYSLLGIFDINMPLLYGEGSKAFFRLQQQIASERNDLSLFAWQREPSEPVERAFSGIFADSPDDFRRCSTLKQHSNQSENREFAITTAGLRVQDDLVYVDPSDQGYLLPLCCVQRSEGADDEYRWIAVSLVKVGDAFFRRGSASIVTTSSRLNWTPMKEYHPKDIPRSIYIQASLRSNDAERLISRFLLRSGVVVVYSKDLGDAVCERSGLPRFHSMDSTPGNTFVFDMNGYENLLAVHSLRINRLKQHAHKSHTESWTSDGERSHETVAILCALEWVESSFQLRFGLFDIHDLKPQRNRRSSGQDILDHEVTGLLSRVGFSTGLGQRVDEPDLGIDLAYVEDKLLVDYSDTSGLLIQDKMPTRLQATVLGRHGVLTVRELKRGEEGMVPADFTWRKGFHHILVEHRLQSRTKRNT